MVIFTDLSEVLIQGINGTENIIAKRFGDETSNQFMVRRQQMNLAFCSLLRGYITEDDYWDCFLSEQDWPFTIYEIEQMFSENLRQSIPGTLRTYQNIISHPRFPGHCDHMLLGSPIFYLVSDHIRERLFEIQAYHPEVFNHMSQLYWSCYMGKIKQDSGFFAEVLRLTGVDWQEALFVDDDPDNVMMARREGVASIKFDNAAQLKTALKRYGCRFRY